MKVRLTLRLHGDSLGEENVVLEVDVLVKVGLEHLQQPVQS